MHTPIRSDDWQPTVLVADDDESMRTLMQAALEMGGFRVILVETGTDAISEYERSKPDLVVLDVEMPGATGFDVCEYIRGKGDYLVPVVIVTGCEDTPSIDQAFEIGATDFVSKPVNWALVAHRFRYIVRGALTHRALNTSESQNRALLEALPDQIFILDADGRVEQEISNQCVLALNARDGAIGSAFSTLLPKETIASFEASLKGALRMSSAPTFEFAITPADSETCHYECRLVAHDVDRVLAIVRDVTERKQTEQKIHELAYFDALTGIANRHLFMQHADFAIAESERANRMLGLLYLDLDQFKRINDTLGHETGDRLLVAVVERLQSCLEQDQRSDGTNGELARMGGDEFVVMLKDLDSERSAIRVAQRLNEALAQPFIDGQHNLVITPSIGISIYPRDGIELVTLLKNADTAMHRAKESGRNMFRIYAETMNARAAERLTIEGELRRALDSDQLSLHYQPRFCAQSLSICGSEALLRWVHPDLGNVSPADFIPIAESTGLISEIDRWVMHSACIQQRDWQSNLVEPQPISINLSAGEFYRDAMAGRLLALALGCDLTPDMLEIEITEGVLMQDAETTRATLAALKDAGFRIAIDDFGTGYSSLAYLKSFAVDVLKIDRSFVADLERDADNQSICRAIIAMAHSLKLQVVAEGVETVAQYRFLRDEGCDQIQGYWSGRPMDVPSYEQFLKRHEPSMLLLGAN